MQEHFRVFKSADYRSTRTSCNLHVFISLIDDDDDDDDDE